MLAHFEDALPADHPFKRLAGHLPGGARRPEVWLLGSSPQSAVWAAQLGLPYSFADFINPGGAEIAKLYRQRFERDAGRLEAPRVSVGAWVIVAGSDDEAVELAQSARMAGTMRREGRPIAVPPVEKAKRFFEARPPSGGRGPGRRMVLGAPETVRAELEALAAAYGADEVIAVTITFDPEARRESYRLLAGAFGI